MPPWHVPGGNFVAIDFETAATSADSACAVGLIKVMGGRIVNRTSLLIRPPSRAFIFTYIHGIAWKDVQDKPDFAALWPQISAEFEGAEYLAAHNAPFDQGVLEACCRTVGVRPPNLPFLCTVRLARQVWNVRPTKLPNVCEHLGLELNHHEALSDAEACANIVLAARRDGLKASGRAKTLA